MSLPVPYSYRTYAGDGTTDVFSVPFPYIVKAHVRVYVNWSVDDGLFDAELLDGVGFNWVGDTSINVTTAPTAPDTISVVRLTPVDQRVTQWQAGSPPTAFELTAADEQVLFVVQEFIDRVLATQGTLNFVISDGLTTVIDNLLSTSPTAALSANQGRVLKGLIDALATAVAGIIAGGGGGGGGGGAAITVENILTSTSATNALSANQGRVLKGLIDALTTAVDGIIAGGGAGAITVENVLTSTSATNALSANQGRVLKELIDNSGTTLATTTVEFTAPDVADLAVADFTIPVGELAILKSVTLGHPGWLRLFRSASQRAADTRLVPGGALQAVIDLGDSKPYAEFVTTGTPQTIICNPVPSLRGDGTDPAGLVYARLVNRSGDTRAIAGNLTIIQLEV